MQPWHTPACRAIALCLCSALGRLARRATNGAVPRKRPWGRGCWAPQNCREWSHFCRPDPRGDGSLSPRVPRELGLSVTHGCGFPACCRADCTALAETSRHHPDKHLAFRAPLTCCLQESPVTPRLLQVARVQEHNHLTHWQMGPGVPCSALMPPRCSSRRGGITTPPAPPLRVLLPPQALAGRGVHLGPRPLHDLRHLRHVPLPLAQEPGEGGSGGEALAGQRAQLPAAGAAHGDPPPLHPHRAHPRRPGKGRARPLCTTQPCGGVPGCHRGWLHHRGSFPCPTSLVPCVTICNSCPPVPRCPCPGARPGVTTSCPLLPDRAASSSCPESSPWRRVPTWLEP